MVSVNDKLLNSTIAGNIAQKLDAQDGKTDGQISKSIWDKFLKDNNINGNTVNESISTVSAMNSITTYAVRICKNAGQSVDELANTWLAKLNIIDTKEVKEETPVEEQTDTTEKTPDETPEETVKKILDTNQINDIDDEMLKDIVSKYNLIKQINPDITDKELQSRISNYAKALQSHKTELEMGTYFAECIETEQIEDIKNCPIKVIDKDIQTAIENDDNQAYLNGYINKGEGYVEMYDTNGDQKIDLDEFTNLEQTDNGETLGLEELEITKITFNKLDKNHDSFIDKTEMASHLYATSHLYDKENENTGSEVSFHEWYGTQTALTGENTDAENSYNKWSDCAYDGFKKMNGADK